MKIIFDHFNGATANEAADELRRVAEMIADGFTSGELVTDAGRGWWSIEGELTEDEPETFTCRACGTEYPAGPGDCPHCGLS